MKRISVIVPVYNKQKYLEQCLNSIKIQTYSKFELIIVDNESTDNSLNIAQRFFSDNIATTKFPIIISSAKNIYPRSYWEPVSKALSISHGQTFTIIGADDILEPDYLKNCNKVYNALKNKYIAF